MAILAGPRGETPRQFGSSSDFGLRKRLRFFDFRAPAAARPPTRFGIRSDFGFFGDGRQENSLRFFGFRDRTGQILIDS